MHTLLAKLLVARSYLPMVLLTALFSGTLERCVQRFQTAVLLDQVLLNMPVQDQGCADTCFYFAVSDLVQSYVVRQGSTPIGFSAAWLSSCKPMHRQLPNGFELQLRDVSTYPYPVWDTYSANMLIAASLAEFNSTLASLGMSLNGTSAEEIIQATSDIYGHRKAAGLFQKLLQSQVFNDFPIDHAACDILGNDRCNCGAYTAISCMDSVIMSAAAQQSLRIFTGTDLQSHWYEARFRRQLWQQSPAYCFASPQHVHDDDKRVAETGDPRDIESIAQVLKSYGAVGIKLCADKLHTFHRGQGILSFHEPCLHPDHNVVLVGLNLSSIPPFWIVRNTWGQSWGENGYFRVAINSKCGIQSMQSYAIHSLKVMASEL